jgi:hypothetical protein
MIKFLIAALIMLFSSRVAQNEDTTKDDKETKDQKVECC